MHSKLDKLYTCNCVSTANRRETYNCLVESEEKRPTTTRISVHWLLAIGQDKCAECWVTFIHLARVCMILFIDFEVSCWSHSRDPQPPFTSISQLPKRHSRRTIKAFLEVAFLDKHILALFIARTLQRLNLCNFKASEFPYWLSRKLHFDINWSSTFRFWFISLFDLSSSL